MTEKRFAVRYEDNNYEEFFIIDNQKKKETNCHDVADLLNELSEENDILKQQVDYRKGLLADYLQKVTETLQKEYQLIKRNNHISNTEKIVSKLEVEKIADMLGVDLK